MTTVSDLSDRLVAGMWRPLYSASYYSKEV